MFIRISLWLIFLSLQALTVWGQGTFFVEEYDSEIYGAHRQNWAIVQDSSGYMFFGNQVGGLVKYDGAEWSSSHLPAGHAVRSLANIDGQVYWGGAGDFGYIGRDTLNRFNARSMRSNIDPFFHNFSDVWRIVGEGENVFFQPYEDLYIYKKDTIDVLNTEDRVLGLFKLGDRILIKIENRGLLYVKGDQLVDIEGSEDYANDPFYVVLPLEKGHLFISRKQRFMKFDGERFEKFETEAADYVKEHDIYRGTYVNKDTIALATLSGGIVVINTNGRLLTILTEEDGLPTDVIYELYLDREGTLWAATDDGLAKILINNPVTRLDERIGLEGSATFLGSTASTVYFGTTEGLFSTDETERIREYSAVSRVYDGSVNGQQVWISTFEGLFNITKDESKPVSETPYHVIENSEIKQEILYGYSDGMIYRLEDLENEFVEVEYIPFDTPVQDLYEDGYNLWVVTKRDGIFKYGLEGTLINQYETDNSQDEINLKIDHIEGKLRLGTDGGLYVYDAELDSFVVDTTFPDTELNSRQVIEFRQCADKEVWFRSNRKIKRAVWKDNNWEMIEDSYHLIDGGESITEIECGKDGTIWFGGAAGAFHLSDPDWKYSRDYNSNITGVLVRRDSLIYGGYGEPDTKTVLPYSENELRFTYAAASYVAPEENTYRVRLRGYDEGWSSWTSETEKDYTFIPEGTYTFEVQGRNVYHKTSSIDVFTFTIRPPWYRTIWAYISYLLLIGGLLYGFHRLRINRILREQRIRNRIASDLHDEVSATLSSITYFAQAIRQVQNGSKGRRFINLISESASEAKEKITDIIWSIDPENDDWWNLLAKCRRFASDLLESKGIDYALDIDTDIDKPLDLELRQHLWLIFKEMVTNAARHSGASRVDIVLGFDGEQLVLQVQDNGSGFDSENSHRGNGIKNIRARADKINARLSLESDSEIGTRWRLKIKI